MLTKEEEAAAAAEQAAAAAAEAETRRQAEVDAANDKARQAEEARIRAEAERDAVKELANQARAGQGAGWSEEQWQQFTEKTGLSRDAVLATGQMAQELVAKATKELDERVKKAEERAARAEERAGRLESTRTEDSVKADFLRGRPNLQRYQKDVDDFLADFPAEIKQDPVKLKGLLEKAELYVKGKVGDKLMRTGPAGSTRGGASFDRGSEDHPDAGEGDELEPDVSGLDRHQADLVRSIVPSKERLKSLRDLASDTREGIALSGQREWAEAETARRKQFGRPG